MFSTSTSCRLDSLLGGGGALRDGDRGVLIAVLARRLATVLADSLAVVLAEVLAGWIVAPLLLRSLPSELAAASS